MMNIADNVWRHAESGHPGLALREGDDAWTYEQVREHASWMRRRLEERGVRQGDRILFVLPTSAEFVFAYYGALSLGATVVSVNTLCAPRELEYFLEDAQCTLALGWEEAAGPVTKAAESCDVPLWVLEKGAVGTAEPLPLVDVRGDDAAILLYTSGTTGRPKGAVLTHDNVLWVASTFARKLGLTHEDRLGTALPLFHVFGQITVMGTIHSAGASLSLLRPFNAARMLEMAAKHELTAMAGVPTMWNEMLHAETDVTKEDLRNLRLASSGGAALPLEVQKAFADRFGAEIVDGYGLSETTGAATFNAPGIERREGSVGRALEGVSITLLDPDGNPVPAGEIGEVAIDGPVVMREYWNRPDATADSRRGPWFLTGDLARMDEDGFIWIVDRKKDLIIRGGYNVYPREVEEVLYTHPAVREAAVVGVPDERLGEEIAAVVALNEDASLEPAELRAWLGEQLSSYKVPRIYQIMPMLPKGATGKILKREIDRDALLDAGARPARA